MTQNELFVGEAGSDQGTQLLNKVNAEQIDIRTGSAADEIVVEQIEFGAIVSIDGNRIDVDSGEVILTASGFVDGFDGSQTRFEGLQSVKVSDDGEFAYGVDPQTGTVSVFDIQPLDRKQTVDSVQVLDGSGILYTGESVNGLVADQFAVDGIQSGLLQGDVTLSSNRAAARFGSSSLQFGLTAQLSTIELPDTMNLGTDFTLAAFVRTDQTGRFRLFSSYDGATSVRTGELVFDYGSGRLRFLTGLNSLQTGAVTLADNVYHHVAATFDAGEVRLYIDGQLVGSDTFSGQEFDMFRNLRFGEDSAGNVNEQFQGSVDDILVLRQALTDAEVSVLATLGAQRLNEQMELDGASDLEISADGQYVYVTSRATARSIHSGVMPTAVSCH